MTDVVIALTTVASPAQGEAIARALVEERLAACVNLLPPMISIYRWKGSIERETEQQVVIKTTRSRIAAVEARVRTLHTYEVPEFIVFPVDRGGAAYLEWVGTVGA